MPSSGFCGHVPCVWCSYREAGVFIHTHIHTASIILKNKTKQTKSRSRVEEAVLSLPLLGIMVSISLLSFARTSAPITLRIQSIM